MMVVDPRKEIPAIDHLSIRDFPRLVEAGDVVVLNDTRVFPARLFASPRGNQTSPTEVFLTRSKGAGRWEVMCRPARRIRTGDVLTFSSSLTGRVVEKRDDGVIVIDLEIDDESSMWEEIEKAGVTPLPPYIRRETSKESDRERYQTIYASRRGAIAAPTAGLHFTSEILDAVRARGATITTITLHVGLGTFKPVKVDDVREHTMDSEWYEISVTAANVINTAKREGSRIIAVGTTTVRTLESAGREGILEAGSGETEIFITPGFRFRMIDSLLTNFHLPESTLLMLVSAFAGTEVVRLAYREAIAAKYLFYSYGDCMFIPHRNDRKS